MRLGLGCNWDYWQYLAYSGWGDSSWKSESQNSTNYENPITFDYDRSTSRKCILSDWLRLRHRSVKRALNRS